jgi:hypothetical protein
MRLALFLIALASPAAAQVDPSGPWRTLHTEHFRIHFRPTYRALAVNAAAEAERAYALLANELHPPRGTIDLTVSDDQDFPNGFASTYPSNRFTILAVPPVDDPGLRTYDSWIRLVVVHELSHVFHLDRSRRLWKTLQTLFGRVPGLFPNQYQPSWVTEGLATYYESRFTGGGRAAGAFHREVVAADAVAGTTRSPWDALLFTRWPNGLAPYAYGSQFWDYLAARQGDSIVPKFVETTAGQLIPFRIGRPLRRIGAARALTEDWRGAITTATPTNTASSSRVLVRALRAQPVPRVSPDGRLVVYLHGDGRGAPRLRVIDPASGATLRSHRVTALVSYDWVGDTIVVAQLEFANRWSLRSDLWRWSPEGAWSRATTNARLATPRAGGGKLALLELGPGDNTPQGTAHAPGTTWGAVVPSPDGRWMAATRHQNGRWSLVRWPAGSPGAIEVLAQPAGGAFEPAWSGDGVLFVSDVDGFSQVLRWTSAGVVQITAEPLGARSPASLSDGTLLFTTLGRDGWELRTVAPMTGRRVETAAVSAPFDSAALVTTRETGYSAWPGLRPHFWIPLALNADDAGFFFGGATAGVDPLNRYAYYADAELSPSPLRAQGTAIFVTNALGDPTLDFAVSNDWSLVGTDSTGHVVSSEHREGGIGATVFAHHWRSFVALRLSADYEGRRYVSSPDTILSDICNGCRQRNLIGGSVGLSLGSGVGGPLTVSAQDGGSISLMYRRRDEQGSARWLSEVRARGALYARLGPRLGFAYPVLALRFAAGAFDGPLEDRLSVGGVSSGAANLAFGLSLGTTRSFPVRGYRGGTLRGRRAATVSAEYRVPLALLGKSLGHLPLGADKIAVTFFADVGDAWNPGQRARLHRLRSVGAELVADLTVSYDLPLRARVGVAQPATGHPKLYAAFGADF